VKIDGMYAPTDVRPASPNSLTPVAPWLWAAFGLGSAGFTIVLLVVLGWQPVLTMDVRVADWMHVRALAHPGWAQTNLILTDWFWDPMTMRVLTLAAAVWLWRRGARPLALWCIATAAVCWGVQQGLKLLVGRDRPRWQEPIATADYAAMPSGHAMTTALTCALLAWMVWRSGAVKSVRGLTLTLACVSAAGVCLTRIVVGVHWLTDTLVGALLGAALAAAAIGAWNSGVNRSTWADRPASRSDPAGPPVRDSAGNTGGNI
jgi:membrane-associated phospholipid phosphatase